MLFAPCARRQSDFTGGKGSSYFFNRIGRRRTLGEDSFQPEANIPAQKDSFELKLALGKRGLFSVQHYRRRSFFAEQLPLARLLSLGCSVVNLSLYRWHKRSEYG